MKITCGTDIIEIERIEKAIEKSGNIFLREIFTPKEIEYCQARNKVKYQHFAARFAAKEAIFKAISYCLKDKYEIKWTDIEITNEENGKPIITFLKNKIEGMKLDLSISHCKQYAVAMVVAIKEG